MDIQCQYDLEAQLGHIITCNYWSLQKPIITGEHGIIQTDSE